MVEVVIPWRGGCEHRNAALLWTLDRLKWMATIADVPEGPWNKGRAVMGAVSRSGADIVVMHDADVHCPGLQDAIDAVQAGAAWAVPHRGVHRLSKTATAEVLAGTEPHHDLEHAQRPYLGVRGGGIVVAPREIIRSVPIDPRFEGWGQEDESWGVALTTLLGPPWRGTAPLWHLWHPPQQRMSRRRGNRDGWRLYQRYRSVREDPARMRALVQEAHDALSPSHDTSHDPPPLARR